MAFGNTGLKRWVRKAEMYCEARHKPGHISCAQQLMVSAALVVAYLLLSLLWQDLSFYDESNYLDSGLHVTASWFLRQLSSAPLFALWYRFLGVFVHDAVPRYFTSWVCIVLVLGCLPAVLRLRFAWLYTFTLTALPVFSLGSVSLFAAVFVVTATSFLLKRGRTVAVGSLTACCCCFAISFVRPEYAYGTCLAAVTVLACCVLDQQRIASTRAWGSCGLSLLLCGITIAVLRHSDAARSGQAFAQHFNLRASQRGVPFTAGTEISPYAYQAFHLPYGDNPVLNQVTIGDFFAADPLLFLAHVARNIADPFFLLAFAFILCGAAVVLLQRTKREHVGAAVFITLLTFPVFASSLLIYPRHHYALIVFPSALLLNFYVFAERLEALRRVSPHVVLLVAVPFLLLFPAYKSVHRHSLLPSRRSLADVRCLRDLEFSNPSSDGMMFDPSGIPGVYLRTHGEHVPSFQFAHWNNVASWSKRQSPGWILITPFVADQYATSLADMRLELVQNQGYTEHACSAPSVMTVYTRDEARLKDAPTY